MPKNQPFNTDDVFKGFDQLYSTKSSKKPAPSVAPATRHPALDIADDFDQDVTRPMLMNRLETGMEFSDYLKGELTPPPLDAPDSLSEWYTRFNPAPHLRAAMADPETAWWQKGLTGLAAPFTLIPRAAEALAYEKPHGSFAEVGMDISERLGGGDAGTWAGFGLGSLLDVYSDPLTFTKFGPGELYNAAKMELHSISEAGVSGKAGKRVLPWMRKGVDLDEDTIRDFGAPRLMQKELISYGHELNKPVLTPEGKVMPVDAVPERLAKIDTLNDTMRRAYGASKEEGETGVLFGTDQFRARVSELMKDKQVLKAKSPVEAGYNQEILADPTVAAKDRVESLARGQAFKAKAIHADRPGVQLFNWRTPLGSPIEGARNLASKTIGKWRGTKSGHMPLGEFGVAADPEGYVTAQKQFFGPDAVLREPKPKVVVAEAAEVVDGTPVAEAAPAEVPEVPPVDPNAPVEFERATFKPEDITPDDPLARRKWAFNRIFANVPGIENVKFENVSAMDFMRLLEYTQTGPIAFTTKRVGSGVIVSLKSLKNWLTKEMKGVAPEFRPSQLDAVESVYNQVLDIVSYDPKAWFGVSPKAVTAARDEIRRLRSDLSFWREMPEAKQGLNTVDGVMRFRDKAQQEVLKAEKELRESVDELKMLDLNDPDQFVHGVRLTRDIAKKATEKGQKAVNKFVKINQVGLQTRLGYKHGAPHRDMLNKAGIVAGQIRRNMEGMAAETDAVWKNSGSAGLTGTELLVSVPSKTWDGLIATIQEAYPNVQPPALTNDMLVGMRTDIARAIERTPQFKQAQQLLADASTTAELRKLAQATLDNAVTVQSWITRMKPESVYTLVDVMTDIASHVKRGQLETTLMERVMKPMIKMASRMRDIWDRTKHLEFRRLTDEWSAWQAVHDENWLGKQYKSYVQPKLQAIEHSVLRKAGVPIELSELLSRYDGRYQRSHTEATDFTYNMVLKNVRDILAPGVSDAVKSRIPFHVIDSLSEDFFKIMAFGPGKYQINPTWSAEKLAGVRKIANEMVDVGTKRATATLQRLEGITGIRLTLPEVQAQVQELINSVMDMMFQIERQAGQAIMHRADYLPAIIDGSWEDVAAFWDRIGKHTTMVPDNVDPILVSQFHAPSLRRKMQNAAELEYEIRAMTADMASKFQPVKIRMVQSLWPSIAHRKYLHNNLLSNLEMLSELRSVLPHHVMPMVDIRAFGKMRILPEAGGKAKTVRMADVGAVAVDMKMQKDGFQNLGRLVPTMDGWYVRNELYNYMKDYASVSNMTGLEAHQELGNWINRWARLTKRWNILWDLNHAKNVMALAIIADIDPLLWAKTFSQALGIEGLSWNPKTWGKVVTGPANRILQHGGGSLFERITSPMRAFADALREDPMFREGEAANLFAMRGHEVQMPVYKAVEQRFKVTQPTVGSTAMHIPNLARIGTGPFDTFLFDVLDASARLTLYKQFRAKGLPPVDAASAANHYLIDYSTKWMKPGAKKIGMGIFPFFAWQIGNIMLHIPNVIQNPRWYALLAHTREMLTDRVAGPVAASGLLPDALAGAVATLWTDPQNNLQTWVQFRLPWDAPLKTFYKIATGSMDAPAAVLKYAVDRTWDLPSAAIRSAYSPWDDAAMDDYTWSQRFFGTPERKGDWHQVAWGIEPYSHFAGVMFDKRRWQTPGFWGQEIPRTLVYDAIRLGVPLEQVMPAVSDRTGQLRVYRGP